MAGLVILLPLLFKMFAQWILAIRAADGIYVHGDCRGSSGVCDTQAGRLLSRRGIYRRTGGSSVSQHELPVLASDKTMHALELYVVLHPVLLLLRAYT